MAFIFKIYDDITDDYLDIANKIKNESFMSVSVDFIKEHLAEYSGIHLQIPKLGIEPKHETFAWIEENGIVIWSGYVKNILETKINWEFDILSEIDYINNFDTISWAGSTPRDKLEDALKTILVEHDFESDTLWLPPSGFTSPSGNRFWVTNSHAYSGTKAVSSHYVANNTDEQRAFTRQTSGKMSFDFRFFIEEDGNTQYAMKVYIKDGSNILAACSIQNTGNKFVYWKSAAWNDSGKTFNLEAWNKVTFELDLDVETYSLYINRVLAHSDDLVTLSSGGCDTILFEHDRSSGADRNFYMDDLYIFDEWTGTKPYEIVKGMDSGADTLLDTTVGGLSSLSYTAKKQGDLLHDMLMIMAAIHNGNNEFLLCLPIDKELRFYTEFDTNVLTAADIIDFEWADSEDKELIEKISTTAEINSNLKAASGTITESISGGYLIYQIKHKFRSINRYDLGDFIEYPSGTDRGIITGIEKEGPIYTYELTDLAYGL